MADDVVVVKTPDPPVVKMSGGGGFNIKGVIIAAVIIVGILLYAFYANSDDRIHSQHTTQELSKTAAPDYPQARADRIYAAVCAQVAREANPSHPAVLTPTINVTIDKLGDNFLQVESGVWTIHMTKWDEGMYAMGVAQVASTQVLTRDQIMHAAKVGLSIVQMTVDANELK